VPVNAPVVVEKAAHAGLFAMLNVSGSLSASLAVGVNAYALPCSTEVAGVPEIVGARFACDTTIENAASDALALPSLTLIVMFAAVPTFAEAGVPVNCPVVVLNVSHDGLFVMLNVKVVPASASLAVGVNV
jgi:hypothetical protein